MYMYVHVYVHVHVPQLESNVVAVDVVASEHERVLWSEHSMDPAWTHTHTVEHVRACKHHHYKLQSVEARDQGYIPCTCTTLYTKLQVLYMYTCTCIYMYTCTCTSLYIIVSCLLYACMVLAKTRPAHWATSILHLGLCDIHMAVCSQGSCGSLI